MGRVCNISNIDIYKKCLLTIFLSAVYCLPSTLIFADGKFYVREEEHPNLPFQRAVISYQDGVELLILQSEFEGKAEEFGWVVPVPALPKLDSIDVSDAEKFFWKLTKITAPAVIDTKVFVRDIAFFIMLCAFIILLVVWISRAIRHKPVTKFFTLSAGYLICLILLIAILAAYPYMLGSRKGALQGVEILKEQQVAIYDVKVIKSNNATDLINWLLEHKYKFTKEDEETFNSYIRKGWCFVTARLTSDIVKKAEDRVWSSLVFPLVLEFQTNEMIYPLSLTATVGSDTEILLYIFARNKTTTDKRFKLEFAGETDISLSDLKVESNEIDLSKYSGRYLSKLRGKLSPPESKMT